MKRTQIYTHEIFAAVEITQLFQTIQNTLVRMNAYLNRTKQIIC